jgi:hypothetical protein
MHALRHTAVSVWLSRGIGARAVAEFIGDTEHTVIPVYSVYSVYSVYWVYWVYSNLMPDDRDKARRVMDEFVHGPAVDPSQGGSGKVSADDCALNVPQVPARRRSGAAECGP